MTSSTKPISIPLQELLLRPSTLQRFTKRGFESTNEIEESRLHGGINLLASELDVSLQEAAALIREVQTCLGSYCSKEDHPNTYEENIITAYEWLHHQRAEGRRHIVTFCRSIDELLGGGIEVGQVTEISGLPGTGKTQLAIQLGVLARLPSIFGGVEGRSLYIDAEGSFVPERAYAMAGALCQHVQGTAQKQNERKRKHHNAESSVVVPIDFNTEGILASMEVFRVHDEAALLATLYSLEHHIQRHSKSPFPVKLIVIDSIAFHFRAVTPTDSSYYLQRTKTLAALAAHLGDLARKHDLAILVINQMTTKLGAKASVVPALGESWAHATATRIILSQSSNNAKTCSLIKSAHRPNGTAMYRILEEGIRDLPVGNKRSRTSR